MICRIQPILAHMKAQEINLELLANKIAAGESLTAQDKLAIVSRRPTPSLKEWLVLFAVWIVRGTYDLNKAVAPKSLVFLKQHLSAPVFAYLTKSLRDERGGIQGETEAVTMWDIKRLLDQRKRLRSLQLAVTKEQNRIDAIARQREACRQPDESEWRNKVASRREAIENLNVVEAILPAAHAASKLRACGLRLVGDETASAALELMASEGNEDAEIVMGNLFPHGHAEIGFPTKKR